MGVFCLVCDKTRSLKVNSVIYLVFITINVSDIVYHVNCVMQIECYHYCIIIPCHAVSTDKHFFHRYVFCVLEKLSCWWCSISLCQPSKDCHSVSTLSLISYIFPSAAMYSRLALLITWSKNNDSLVQIWVIMPLLICHLQ